MTCLLALSGNHGAALFSDSQISTDAAEAHGFQKLLVGEDFLLGAMGNSLVAREVFNSLWDSGNSQCNVRMEDVAHCVSTFVRDKVVGTARPDVGFLLVHAPKGQRARNRAFLPRYFVDFIDCNHFACYGSGASFVATAQARDERTGVYKKPERLEDLMIGGDNYLEAASQSLTVNSSLVVGFLTEGRAYLMGDAAIRIEFAPLKVKERWREVGKRYSDIMALVQSVRGEIRDAQRAVAKIQTADLDRPDIERIAACRESIRMNRQKIADSIKCFCVWYDALTGRPPR